MRERFSPEQPEKSMKEYRQDFFEKMKKDTRVFRNDEYQKVFVLHKQHWGINSPACILDHNLFDKHPHPEILPTNIEGDLIAINGDKVDKKSGLRCDQIITFSHFYAAKKYPDKLRRIKYCDEETKRR